MDVNWLIPWIYKNNSENNLYYINIYVSQVVIYSFGENTFKDAERWHIKEYGYDIEGKIMTYKFVSDTLNKILYYSFLEVYNNTKNTNMKKYIFDNFLLDINKLSFVDDNFKINLHPYIGIIEINGKTDHYDDSTNWFKNMICDKYFHKIFDNYEGGCYEGYIKDANIVMVSKTGVDVNKLTNDFINYIKKYIKDITKVNINIDKKKYLKYKEFEQNKKLLRMHENVFEKILKMRNVKKRYGIFYQKIFKILGEIEAKIKKDNKKIGIKNKKENINEDYKEYKNYDEIDPESEYSDNEEEENEEEEEKEEEEEEEEEKDDKEKEK